MDKRSLPVDRHNLLTERYFEAMYSPRPEPRPPRNNGCPLFPTGISLFTGTVLASTSNARVAPPRPPSPPPTPPGTWAPGGLCSGFIDDDRATLSVLVWSPPGPNDRDPPYDPMDDPNSFDVDYDLDPVDNDDDVPLVNRANANSAGFLPLHSVDPRGVHRPGRSARTVWQRLGISHHDCGAITAVRQRQMERREAAARRGPLHRRFRRFLRRHRVLRDMLFLSDDAIEAVSKITQPFVARCNRRMQKAVDGFYNGLGARYDHYHGAFEQLRAPGGPYGRAGAVEMSKTKRTYRTRTV